MTWQIVRSVRPVQIVRAPSGPRGQAAAQDIQWVFSLSLGAGETAYTGPLPHAQALASLNALSLSGFALAQTITVNQYRGFDAGVPVLIASATLPVGPGAGQWSGACALACQAQDFLGLVLPSSADPQCIDLAVTLGSP